MTPSSISSSLDDVTPASRRGNAAFGSASDTDSKANRYFITATGTGIGKTLFTCALSHQLRAQGKRVRALKPVISGFDAQHLHASDTGLLLAASGTPLTMKEAEAISPWRFSAPLSPDMAAEDEGKSIDFNRLIAFCRAEDDADYLLVEGVGGVMTPLSDRHTVIDWAAALGFPVILLTGSALGALSHTLAAARVIAQAGLALHAVVISESEASTVPLARTEATLRRHLPDATRLWSIARLDSCEDLWKYASNFTQYFLP